MSYAAVIPPRRDRHRMQHNADIGLFTEPSTHACSAGSIFAFIGLPEDDDVDLAILPHTEGGMVTVSFIF